MLGPEIYLSTLLFPLVLLSSVPHWVAAVFALAALVVDPVVMLMGLTGPVTTLFHAAYLAALLPALLDWLLTLRPLAAPANSRARVARAALMMSGLLITVGLFVVAPAELTRTRLAASPLAPALREVEVAPSGWLLTDSHDLWQQAVSFGADPRTARVVSPRNVDSLRERLAVPQTSIWVLQSDEPVNAQPLAMLVSPFYPGVEETLANNVRLQRFATPAEAPPRQVGATFVDDVTLSQVRVPHEICDGSLLPVELLWGNQPGQQSLFLHLLAPDGQIVSQRDGLPAPSPDKWALQVPVALEPGTYTLVAGRYDPQTMERVPLAQGADSVILGTIQIGIPGTERCSQG
jgi:hypothetical protein